MSERRQAIIITTGMDNLPLLAALKENEGLTGASLNRVKALYAKFNAEKAAMDAAENDASLARLKANEEAKAVMTKAYFTEQAAQYDIAAGSIPESMAIGGAGGAALGASSRNAAREVGEVGHQAHGTATALRESTVLVREGFRHNWSRMIGSFSILATAISGWIFVIGAAVAAIVAPSAIGAYGAYKGMKAGQAGEKEMDARARRHAEDNLRLLEKYKALDVVKSEGIRDMLSSGRQDDLFRAMNQIRQFMGAGGRAGLLERESLSEQTRKLQEELDKKLSKKEREVNLESEISDLQEKIKYNQASMAAYDQNAIEYNRMHVSLLEEQNQLQDDLVAKKKEEADLAEQVKKFNEFSNRAAIDFMKQKIAEAQKGAAYPTLEDLAGRGRTDRLNELYGRGGRFDLGAGNGPFADIAYDAELAQKQQAWDRIHGNFNQAELDRRRYNLDISQIPVGALSPQEALGRIGENTGQLRELFDRLVTQGAIINTNIAGVSG